MDIAEGLSQSRDQTIQQVRELSRRLVRELGFMRPHLAESGLAPSAVHAIIEVGLQPGMQASELARILRLDKSNASRQLARLERMGLLRRERDSDDARAARLFLTQQGTELRASIDRFATNQVSQALRRLAPPDQQALLRMLAMYGDALSSDNATPGIGSCGGHVLPVEARRQAVRADARHESASPPAHAEAGHFMEGYVPGCIGDIAALHARYYAGAVGFGEFFERKVATELAAFTQALPAPGKGLWLYAGNGRILGSIAIDGDVAARAAHLRWFIVDGTLRGKGVGRILLERAVAFADQWYDEISLWTFNGLDAARHLYEQAGFRLAQEAAGAQWGKPVTEQRFSRSRPPAGRS